MNSTERLQLAGLFMEKRGGVLDWVGRAMENLVEAGMSPEEAASTLAEIAVETTANAAGEPIKVPEPPEPPAIPPPWDLMESLLDAGMSPEEAASTLAEIGVETTADAAGEPMPEPPAVPPRFQVPPPPPPLEPEPAPVVPAPVPEPAPLPEPPPVPEPPAKPWWEAINDMIYSAREQGLGDDAIRRSLENTAKAYMQTQQDGPTPYGMAPGFSPIGELPGSRALMEDALDWHEPEGLWDYKDIQRYIGKGLKQPRPPVPQYNPPKLDFSGYYSAASPELSRGNALGATGNLQRGTSNTNSRDYGYKSYSPTTPLAEPDFKNLLGQ